MVSPNAANSLRSALSPVATPVFSPVGNNVIGLNTRNLNNDYRRTLKPLKLVQDRKMSVCRIGSSGRQFARCIENVAQLSTKWKNCNSVSPAVHQNKIYALARAIANDDEYRGQLVWAATGTGKTIMSLAIILAYLESGRTIFVVTTPENLRINGPEKYIENMKRYFPEEYDVIMKTYGRKIFDANERQSIVKFITFEQYRNFLVTKQEIERGAHKGGVQKWARMIEELAKRRMDRFVVIIDEAHRITDPARPLAKKGMGDGNVDMKDIGDRIRRYNRTERRNNHIWLLTATPADSIQRWLKLVSIVRPVSVDASYVLDNTTRMSSIIDRIKGLVAWIDTRADPVSAACVNEFKPLGVPMDSWYYLAYCHKLGTLGTKFDVDDKTLATAKRIGMFLERNEYERLVPDAVIRLAMERRQIIQVTRDRAVWLSHKFMRLCKTLADATKYGGKHYCYTSNSDVADMIGFVLRKWYRYADVTSKAIVSAGDYRTTDSRQPAFVIISKRTTTKSSQNDGASVAAVPNTRRIENIAAAFNARRNGKGAHIRIVIASDRFYEGLDLNALRHLHIADPFSDALNEIQAVGRGVRFCGHALLDHAKPFVNIYRWYAYMPSRKSFDIKKLLATAASGKVWKVKRARVYNNDNGRASPRPDQYRKVMIGHEMMVAASRSSTEIGIEQGYIRRKAITDKDAVALSNFQLKLIAANRPGNGNSPPLRSTVRIAPGLICKR